MTDTIKAIRQAAKRRERADLAWREATDDLRDLIREAQEAGVPIRPDEGSSSLGSSCTQTLLATWHRNCPGGSPAPTTTRRLDGSGALVGH